jgi:hypothetical protein
VEPVNYLDHIFKRRSGIDTSKGENRGFFAEDKIGHKLIHPDGMTYQTDKEVMSRDHIL